MKDKIVGKFFLITTILFLSPFLYAGIEMRMTTMEGGQLSQAGVGVPFLLVVTVSDLDNIDRLKIAGIENFDVHTIRTQTTTINGRITNEQTFRVRIDKPGEYILGPASCKLNSQVQKSNKLRLRVAEEQVSHSVRNSKKKHRDSPAFLQLDVDKKEVYLGENVSVTVRFFSEDALSVEKIIFPEITNFSVKGNTEATTDVETIGGVEYNVMKSKFELYPKQTGDLVIPACSVDFTVQVQRRNRFVFSSLFGPQLVKKRVYSNAVSITVFPLPPHDPPILVIGRFTDLTATVDPPFAKEGEGIVLTLQLEGDGNSDVIPVPELQDMPNSFKWYDSKNYEADDAVTGKPVHYFEYIIQGFEAGNWEIPEQQLVYFDTKYRKYKILKTNLVSVTITPNNNTKLFSSNPSEQNAVSDFSSSSPKENEVDLLCSLNKDGSWYASDTRSMDWYWFFLLAMLPLFYFIFSSLKYFRAYINANYALVLRRKYAFKNAAKQLKIAARSHAVDKLHKIFIDLFAARLQLAEGSVSQQLIEKELRKAGWESKQIEEWNLFFVALAEQIYCLQRQESNVELLKQAKMWLARLERVL